MKRTISLVLVLLVMVAFIPFIKAEAVLSTVYLSASGLDTNDGASVSSPVLTLSKAVTLLGGSQANGTVIIVGEFTYKSTDSYQFPAAQKITIKGYDDNAKFIDARSAGVNLKSDVTFDDIIIGIKVSGWCPIYANGYVLEITSSVTCESPLANKDDRNGYPAIFGGSNSFANPNGAHLKIYGGTYNSIILGSTSAKAVGGTSAIELGGNARVIHSLFMDGGGTIENINVNISGGTYAKIYIASNTSTGRINGNVNVKATGGTFSEINPYYYADGSDQSSGIITVDFSEYERSLVNDLTPAFSDPNDVIIPFPVFDFLGFSIRVQDPTGLRAKYMICDTVLNATLEQSGYTLSEYGAILTQRESFDTVSGTAGAPLTLSDSNGELNGTGKITLWSNGVYQGNIYQQTTDGNIYTAVLVNIKSANLNKDYAFRAYCILKNEADQNIVVYSDVNEMSTYDVALMVLADEQNELTPEQETYIQTNIIDTVNNQ